MKLGNITFDADNPARLAEFWAAATGRTITDSSDFHAVLTDPDSPVAFLIAKVPEGKTAKNRMHLDFGTEDRAAEVARLVSLGATEHETHDLYGFNWTVMRDPEGNEFCVGTPHS
jgi:hypothetical protein